ncbi:ABC transporter transmembrane domain-containing protein [Enterovirga rhinocerotis]|uniref:ATP-binding cassette subfamily B protein n=1 Tax=Enterovirga rhinocerotis TaxID=1339210 RepID=A0A4R7BTH5_9HYPH|nr:ABC transporter transmembrane domain-containing protein [Enterovirga rhinocerotis]TDR88222.1 ATP-binding cassette subfamily B protein [Enterovirga rhinocerotis]
MSSPPPDRRRPSLKALKPLIPYGLAYKGRIAAAIVALAAAAAATLALPIAARRVIDHGFSDGDGQIIDAYFAVLICVVAAIAVASALRFYLVVTLGERIVTDIRSAIFRRLTMLDPAFFDAARSGDLLSRLTADTTQVKSAFGVSISMALRNIALFLGALGMMIVTSPKLSALVILAIPLIVLPLVLSGRAVQRRARAAQDRLADATAYANEAVGAVRTMQAFGTERMTADRFAAAAEAAFVSARGASRTRAYLTGAVIFLVSASVVGILWWGAQDVLAGQMSAGRLSQFVLYAVFAASALGQLSEVYGELAAASGAAERLGEILDAHPAITAPARPLTLPEPPLGTLAFEDVRFAYPSREAQSLRGVSFCVRAGERVALVGPSGAGKSTVFQLLLRFYDPQAGRVLVDGMALPSLDPAALRQRMALVPQEPTIFMGSVLDNIRYGRPDATLAEVERAAEAAAAADFIAGLPEGYETRIGERGVTLSGGQRQRIAIARAVLKDAPILLLDEATSALDAESERAVQTALERLMAGRTSLVIAHRLATVRDADRILVMEDGMIVEEGPHEALIRRDGLYARLAALQFDEPEPRLAVVS